MVGHWEAEDFRQVKDTGVVLADLWATWCMPCRMLAPVIEKLAEQYDGKVTVGKVDIDEAPQIAAEYGVQSIPTVLIFQDGRLVSTLVGARPYEAYAAELDKLL